MVRKQLRGVVTALLVSAAVASAAQGLTVFHIGNSLTDETYGMHWIARGFGNTWTNQIYGRSMIPGCPIHLLWTENVAKTNDASTGGCGFFLESTDLDGYEAWIADAYPALRSTSLYLRAKAYDAVVLQVFPENGDGYDNPATVDGAIGFAGEAYRGNPNCQVYIYPSHTMDIGSQCDLTEYTRIYEPIARAISARYPTRKPACVIPVLSAWNEMMKAGYRDLWSDGHANDNGKYVLITTFYATIYKKSPVGAIYSNWYGTHSVNSAFAAKAQQVAWAAATGYAMSGVEGTSVASDAHAPRIGSVAMSAGGATYRYDISGRTLAPARNGVESARGITVNSRAGRAELTR